MKQEIRIYSIRGTNKDTKKNDSVQVKAKSEAEALKKAEEMFKEKKNWTDVKLVVYNSKIVVSPHTLTDTPN